MFDERAVNLLNVIPEMANFDADRARRTLTEAYLQIVRLRANPDDFSEDLLETIDYLRRLATGLELFGLFEYSQQGQLLESGKAACFIAAQSLEFLSELFPQYDDEFQRHILDNTTLYTQIESGLLYLAAGYIDNAKYVCREAQVREVGRDDEIITIQDYLEIVALEVYLLVIGLVNSELVVLGNESPLNNIQIISQNGRTPKDISDSIESKLLIRIERALRNYLNYLSGGSEEFVTTAMDLVRSTTQAVEEAMRRDNALHTTAETIIPHHLASILEMVFGVVRDYSLIHSIPPLDIHDAYRDSIHHWLRKKAENGHAILSHTVKEWLQHESNGRTHYVFSMPQNAGQDTIVEIATAMMISGGWALYIVPNYLAQRRVREHLESELSQLISSPTLSPTNVRVTSYLGYDYSPKMGEPFHSPDSGLVVITTMPHVELAYRYKPDIFLNCKILFVDGCDDIGSNTRGPKLEYLVERVTTINPQLRIFLFSSILREVHQIAEWLSIVTQGTTASEVIAWKPVRNARCLVTSTQPTADSRTTNLFLTGYSRTAWEDEVDSALIHSSLDFSTVLKNRSNSWKPSVNKVARQVAQTFAHSRIATLLILYRNPHYVWKHANECAQIEWNGSNHVTKQQNLEIRGWLYLAERELGQSSYIADYIAKGITVYSSALIREEKNISELLYQYSLVGLMICMGDPPLSARTSTQAVVMAGIESYPTNPTHGEVIGALSLSALSVHGTVGLSVIVPNKPIFNSSDGNLIREYINILQHQQQSVSPRSALERHIDNLTRYTDDLNLSGVTHADPELNRNLSISHLLVSDNTHDENIQRLKRTFAKYRATDEDLERAISSAQGLITTHSITHNCPQFVYRVATDIGVSPSIVFQIYILLSNVQTLDSEFESTVNFQSKFGLLESIIRDFDPATLGLIFGLKSEPGNSSYSLMNLPKSLGGEDFNWDLQSMSLRRWEHQWREIFNLLRSWLAGDNLTYIAVGAYDLDQSKRAKRNDKCALTKTIGTIYDVKQNLSLLAQCMTELMKYMRHRDGLLSDSTIVPLSLELFSESITHGLDRVDKILWHYHYLSSRQVSHLIAHLVTDDDVLPENYDDSLVRYKIREYSRRFRQNPDLLVSYANDEEQRAILTAATHVMN